MILTEFSPCTPESTSSTLSRMTCEKFQFTPGMRFVQLGAHFGDQFGLGARRSLAPNQPPAGPSTSAGHSRCGFERHEELGTVEAGRIDAGSRAGPVWQTTELDLGILAHDGPGEPRLARTF